MSEHNPFGRSLFVADLHLSEERPEATGRFFHFLDHTAKGADALYILGDLFEYWIGDDDIQNSLARLLADKLKALSTTGTSVFFMHGNRDFLLASDYARLSGMTLLADPMAINLHGTPTLLSHGDQFCTDDTRYQQYRKWVHRPAIQKLLLVLPLKFRRVLAGSARMKSEREKAGKPLDIMDVNPDAVIRAYREYGVTRLIHGHTHRPALHEYSDSGKTLERWVLPDWYENGGYLVCTSAGCKLEVA